MYFVTNSLKKGSLLQRFFDGDDDFRNSRLKLIPSVPKVYSYTGHNSSFVLFHFILNPQNENAFFRVLG
jgi:hypothetical protein